ncbi:MAG: formyl transferase [Hyphomicrobiales bacterium]|nr:MAG: formyl transferase [Hyphomicrobiales bacterium]
MIKVLFMGRKPVAAKCLAWLIERTDVEIVGVLTDTHLSVSPTSEVARKNGIKLFDFESAAKALENGALTFDIGFSMLYWRKLKDHFLSVPPLKIINFHPAPLPEYKGTAGYNIAILEGLKEWGVTAHYVDEEIDTGEIIEISKLPVCYETETAQSLEEKCRPVLFDLFKKIANNAIVSNTILDSYPNKGGVYISRQQMEALKEIKEPDDINRKIRAFWFPPYEGAYIKIGGDKFTLVNQFILQSLSNPNNSSLFTTPSKVK